MLKRDELILKVENIGGIRGKLELKIKQPITFINAPNAAGKSSIVRALQLLCKNPLNLDYILNEYENNGRVELIDEERFFVEIARSKVGIEVLSESKLLWDIDEKAFHTSFCVRDAELIKIIEDYKPERLKYWFRNVSDAYYYESLISIINTLLEEKRGECERLKSIIEVDVKDREIALIKAQKELAEVESELADANRKLKDLGYGDLIKGKEQMEKEISDMWRKISNMEEEKDEKRREEINLQRLYADLEVHRESELNELQLLINELKVEEEAEKIIIARRNDVMKSLDPEKGIPFMIKNLESRLSNYYSTLESIKSLAEAQPCIPVIDACIKATKEELNIKVSERRSLEKELESLNVRLEALKKLRAKVDFKKRSIADYEKRMKEIKERDLPRIRSEIERIGEEIVKSKADIEGRENELRMIIGNILKLEGVSEGLKKRIDELSKKKSELEKDIRAKETELRRALEARSEYERAIKAVKWLEGFLSHLQRRHEYIIDGARNELNKALKDNFELMRFIGLSEIMVTPDYELIVRRKGRPPTKLQMLSSSERLTISLIMMFVAKQAYAPEFPLFVIDEAKEPYDETRFEKIINYIRGKVPYLLITSLVPLKDKVGYEAITTSYME